MIYDLHNMEIVRVEISFKSYDELRKILSFCQSNNLYKINIPCKNNLKKDFLLKSIEISREEFPHIDLVPHFSILHEFKRNRVNTEYSFINFLEKVKYLGCKQILLVSGSQKRSTLDTISALSFIKDRGDSLYLLKDFSIGVAFNPYLPKCFFAEEIKRLEMKLQSGLVGSIWIQFGTDYELLRNRMQLLSQIISETVKKNSKETKIALFGSVLIPSRQFLARFKYRPWKGVYCSTEFLESLDFAEKLVKELLITYRDFNICPLIETNVYSEVNLQRLKKIFEK
tara:strand:- start:285 stop:1136 length:852 start_codon:yes stop_codon:yes gene_type:complete